jgi:hypothetical protein
VHICRDLWRPNMRKAQPCMKSITQPAPSPPTRYEITNFVSASRPTQVQTSPRRFLFSRAHVPGPRTNVDPDLIAPEAAHRQVANVLVVVFHRGLATVHQQLGDCFSSKACHPGVERMLFPTTKAATIRIRPSSFSLFILKIILESNRNSRAPNYEKQRRSAAPRGPDCALRRHQTRRGWSA